MTHWTTEMYADCIKAARKLVDAEFPARVNSAEIVGGVAGNLFNARIAKLIADSRHPASYDGWSPFESDTKWPNADTR